MRKKYLLILGMAALLTACSSNDNDNAKQTSTPVAMVEATTVAPTQEVVTTPPAVLDVSVAPTESATATEVPIETITVNPTVEPTATASPTVEAVATVEATTTAPTKAAVTVEPTKAPTKKPVATKKPATKTPTPTKKATATKKPATSSTSSSTIPTARTEADVARYNSQGKKYKYGGTIITPCNKTMWATIGGNIRTIPNATSSSKVLSCWYYEELKITGTCANGFVQIKRTVKDGNKSYNYVYTNAKFLSSTKPKEFTFKGYDPDAVIRAALKKLRAKGHLIMGDNKDEMVEFTKNEIAEAEEQYEKFKLKKDNYTAEKYAIICKEFEDDIAQYKKDLVTWQNMDYDNEPTYKTKNVGLSGRPLIFNQNLNRLQVFADGCIGDCKTYDDIINCIVRWYDTGGVSHYKKGKDYISIQWCIEIYEGENCYMFCL